MLRPPRRAGTMSGVWPVGRAYSFAGNQLCQTIFVNIDHKVMAERNLFCAERFAAIEHVPDPPIGVVPRFRFVKMQQIYPASLRRQIRRPHSVVGGVVRNGLRRRGTRRGRGRRSGCSICAAKQEAPRDHQSRRFRSHASRITKHRSGGYKLRA